MALSCMSSQAACALEMMQTVGIPLLRKLNQGQIELGELNECSESEKISSYLYADCAVREVTKEGDKLCRIKYGSTVDMSIIYYNPFPSSGVIEFAAQGVKGTLPDQFEINVGAKTGGTINMQLKHQLLVDPSKPNCHTTESDPITDPTGPDPGSIWGLSLNTQNGTIQSEHFPEELVIVTEGNGKGGIAGVGIPCWYRLEIQ